MSYQLVAELSEKAVTVGTLCRVLGVSRSGYYGSRQRAQAAPKVCAASVQIKAEFVASGRVYGSRRLAAVLRSRGLRITHPVRQTELLQNSLRVAHHLFQHGVAGVGMNDLHHLYFVKLVLTNQAPRVTPGTARLRPKARCVRG